MLTKLNDATSTVEFYEGARFHQQRFNEYGSRLDDLADLVRKGLQIPVERYDEAMRYIAERPQLWLPALPLTPHLRFVRRRRQ